MLVLNENTHFKKLNENGFEKYPNKRDLLVLCKGWLQEKEYSDEQLKHKMIEFCKNYNSQFNTSKAEGLFLSVLKDIHKENKFEFNKHINITINEIKALENLDSFKKQKIMFVILSLAKWRNVNYIYLNNGSSIKVSDIFELAKVKCTKKEQFKILHELNEEGFIDVQLKPILKCMIPICDCDSNSINEIEFDIDDDLIFHWENYVLPHCEICGNPFERKSNRQKYCAKCAKVVKNEQNKSYKNA